MLVLHAAFGAEQGRVLDMLRRKAQFKETLVERNPELAHIDLTTLTANELLELGGGVPEDSMTRFGPSALHAARRALSQLILGGVFERFPGSRWCWSSCAPTGSRRRWRTSTRASPRARSACR